MTPFTGYHTMYINLYIIVYMYRIQCKVYSCIPHCTCSAGFIPQLCRPYGRSCTVYSVLFLYLEKTDVIRVSRVHESKESADIVVSSYWSSEQTKQR